MLNTFKCVYLWVNTLLVFHKDVCEAKHEMQSVFKFSDVPFALKSDGTHIDEPLVRLTFFVKPFGQADLWLDICLVETSSGHEWY